MVGIIAFALLQTRAGSEFMREFQTALEQYQAEVERLTEPSEPPAFVIVDEVEAERAFNFPPVYRLPWPQHEAYSFTRLPFEGWHTGANAYDVGMRLGEPIVASERGIVLWVEDSFGRGRCSTDARGEANVVVIQTSPDTNQVYLHLAQGSVQAAGIGVGQVVRRGQWIGGAGNSGFSCGQPGVHAHIEWQQHCFGLDEAIARRSRPGSRSGEATLTWSCVQHSQKHVFTLNSQQMGAELGPFVSDNTPEQD
jgi:murein DD-endopeptidase MepM/ murein hydrolase activator NlpD